MVLIADSMLADADVAGILIQNAMMISIDLYGKIITYMPVDISNDLP